MLAVGLDVDMETFFSFAPTVSLNIRKREILTCELV